MQIHRISMLACMLVTFVWITPSNAALTARIEKVISQQIVPAYRNDQTDIFSKILENLLTKLDAEELSEVNTILKEKGVPEIGEMMLDARIRQVVAQRVKPEKISPREAAMAMPVLRARIEQLLVEIEKAGFLNSSLPDYETIKDYENAFWEIHVATNTLQNAATMTKFGQSIIETSRERKLKNLSDDEIANLEIDFASLRNQLQEVHAELQESKAELRINAVSKATRIVRDAKDFKERLRAAYVINFDGQQVIDFLRSAEISKLTRPALRDPNQLNSITTAVTYARENAGDVALKSRLLYLGMHWWTRGRYGEGPEGMGLLKSSAALSSPLARFPLYMPLRPPTPTDPFTSPSIPRFDRRHHYIWMYEYQSIQTHQDEETYSSQTIDGPIESRIASVTQMSRFY